MASGSNVERMSREDWKKKQELDELVSFLVLQAVRMKNNAHE